MTIEPDLKNPNREPLISIMDLAHLNDEEMQEGYRDRSQASPAEKVG